MKKYGMFLKNEKDLIHITNQNSIKQATKFFAEVKKMPILEFNKIFIVIFLF